MNYKKIYLITAFIILIKLLPIPLYSTTQIPDILFYNKEKLSLLTNPLEDYYNSTNIRPESFFENTKINTACYRGYQAFWEIKNNTLYLKEIKECSGENKADLKKYFPNLYKNSMVAALWFTGTLRCPKGSIIESINTGYMSKYEKELFIKIENGKMAGIEENKNSSSVIPAGYRLERSLNFQAILPAELNSCLNDSESAGPDSSLTNICYQNKKNTLSLSGNGSLNSERLNGEKRIIIVNEMLQSALNNYNEKFVFSSIQKGKDSNRYTAWVNGINNNDHSYIRIFAISGINMKFLVFFKASNLKEKKFNTMADTIFDSLKLMEFGY